MSKKGADKGGKEKEISNLYKELGALRPSADFDPSTEEYEKAIKVGTNSSHNCSAWEDFVFVFRLALI